MFCCTGFEHRIRHAGERGLAILVEETSTGFAFEFQSRGVAHEDEAKLHPIPRELNINIASSVGLQFCPWCGQHVGTMLKAYPALFEELARKHRKLLTLIV